MKCPECQHENPDTQKFCGECGQKLGKILKTEKAVLETEGERKHVTIMFSDLSGYAAMTERLDPEEVKEIMSLIFGKITEIINGYEGVIEKFIGDAVVAIFGVQKAHEDDPIRAIRTAIDIHDAVERFSHQFEGNIGQPLTMHTGINTGLVVTGEIDAEKGTHGLTGDAINLASRLEGIAKAGEIIVGPDTYSQAVNYFEFETLEPAKIKGKQKPVSIYKVQSVKKESFKTRRLHGLQAALIGRDKEMTILAEAAQQLKQGQGSIITIYGDAGTGKSRLKREFKNILNLENIKWSEGHAYGYTQNMPYYPLINLLTHAFHIDEGDPPEGIRKKIETSVSYLLGEKNKYTPYIGSLFALTYPEIEGVSPEYWKDKLRESIEAFLSSLVDQGPIVICFEDLHWADPSFIELLKRLVVSIHQKALFICTYRSNFTLFDRDLIDDLKDFYREIHLKDLATIESQEMLKSLLGTQSMPIELYEVVRQKAEGNPFYIEEMINSLIESEILTRDNGSNWKLNRKITEAGIPATIQGVITARVDRLEKQFKRILQEASVIGRTFLYKILERITDIDIGVDQSLAGLEGLDLIRTQSIEPELEYIFKHALIQEVVYSGLLKKERQKIHERIAIIMEKVFHSRLTEFYETLAFHYKQGESITKAFEYLVKSGEKSLGRYSLEESHQYFFQALKLINIKAKKTKKEQDKVIDLINKWSLAFHFRGAYGELVDLLKAYEDMAATIDDKAKIGLLLTWFGYALRATERLIESHQYLVRALKIGEETENKKIIGLSCAYLAFTCADMGLLDDAVAFGERALGIYQLMESDLELLRFSHTSFGMASWFSGNYKKTYETGKALIDRGEKKSDLRCVVQGYNILGWANVVAGKFSSAIECFEEVIKVSLDPIFSHQARTMLGFSYLSSGQLLKAQEVLEEVIKYNEKFDMQYVGSGAQAFKGILLIAKGNLAQGIKISESVSRSFKEKNSKYRLATHHTLLGNVYLQMVQRRRPISLNLLIRNIGFLVKNIMFVGKKAENHFNKAIDVSKDIGAKGILGQAYLGLGFLHNAKGRIEQARKYFSEAVRVFEVCEAEAYLKQAQEALSSLSI
ncbi:MAG: AAA family ATPase [Desulfobacterales bacterium]|nr:MAG: AAA family ATPase [Desulfobacterales bacterium]